MPQAGVSDEGHTVAMSEQPPISVGGESELLSGGLDTAQPFSSHHQSSPSPSPSSHSSPSSSSSSSSLSHVASPPILLLLLCGLPASGKSSLAGHLQRKAGRQLTAEPVRQQQPHQLHHPLSANSTHPDVGVSVTVDVVSFDAVYEWLQRERLRRRASNDNTNAEPTNHSIDSPLLFQPHVWRTSRQLALRLAETMIDDARAERREHQSDSSGSSSPNHATPSFSSAANPSESARDAPHLIILDDNFHLRSMRRRCFQLARDKQVAFAQLYVQCDVEQAVERNEMRRQRRAERRQQDRNDGGVEGISPIDENRLQRIIAKSPQLLADSTHDTADACAADEDGSDMSVSVPESDDVSEATIRKMAHDMQTPPNRLLDVDEKDENVHNWERLTHSFWIQNPHSDEQPSSVFSQVPWSQLATAFTTAIPTPAEPASARAARLAAARAATMTSLTHILDLMTRKLLSEKVDELRRQCDTAISSQQNVAANKRFMQRQIQHWNEQRKQWLRDAKHEGTDLQRMVQTVAEHTLQSQDEESSSLSGAHAFNPDVIRSKLESQLSPIVDLFRKQLTRTIPAMDPVSAQPTG